MQILETAMQLEIDAEKHYRDMAAQTQDVGLINILNRLAEVEQQHQRVIAAMLKDDLTTEAGDETFIADLKVLFQKLEDSKSDMKVDLTQIELYKHARDRELEAENLYFKAAKLETDPDTVALLNRLGTQETMHAQIINSIIEFLTVAEPGRWMEDAEWYHTDTY